MTNLGFRPASKRRLSDIAALSLSVNHVYTTETLGKELGKEQKTLCEKLLMKHYHDKGLLGWLDGGTASSPRPRIVLNKQIGPEQWDIWKPATSTEELETWTRHFIETSHGHSNYFFRSNQSYFIQVCVPLPFVIAIRNLQLDL